MLSVTQRINTVEQPRGGYVKKDLFTVTRYEDYYEIEDVKTALSSIQGLAVDYLTRFQISGDKEKAFNISIRGALKIDEAHENNNEYENAMSLLDGITGLDRQSVVNACKLVCYDAVVRAGVKSYQPADTILFDEILYKNIPILVKRCVDFLKQVGPVIKDEVTFEEGYTSLVSSGDGDYLTKKYLVDLKVSKKDFSSKWSLQLLMYYILGIHSIHHEFERITKLAIFNPYYNQSHVCYIKDISNKTKYEVSANVLGYKMSHGSYSSWKAVDGSDNYILRKFINNNFVLTDFNINDYGDGIFDIGIDDYWTFIKSLKEYRNSMRPLFRWTSSVKLIKKNEYYMFVSVSIRGKQSLLHGARLHALKYSLLYYYDHIEKYGNRIEMSFSKYWNILEQVSDQIKSLEPTEEHYKNMYTKYLKRCRDLDLPKSFISSFDNWLSIRKDSMKPSGRIHGCIVDIDYYNHIYINPYDGTVTAYNAPSMFDKNVYSNVKSLISKELPGLLPAFNRLIENKKADTSDMIVLQNNSITNPLYSLLDDTVTKKVTKVYDIDMYDISNKLLALQRIHERKWVQVWYDDILNIDETLLEDKYKFKKPSKKKQTAEVDYVGKTYRQKGERLATITAYRSQKDVDIQFEDGHIIESVSLIRVLNGSLLHPAVKEEQRLLKEKALEEEHSNRKDRYKNKYIGMTKKMNCGLNATIIDYNGCHDITIQFEDGYVRSGVRTDKFLSGKVARSK